MDVKTACDTIRRCSDSVYGGGQAIVAADVAEAVRVVKGYLENARADGRPIDELLISASVLLTPQGIRWVMPFVLSVEAMETSKRRARFG